MSNFPNTMRWWSSADSNGNQSAATAALMANGPSILSLTYQLFSTVTNFTTFSCTLPGGRPNVADNVENIHNSIHNSIGGWGHMTFPEVAAFDPMFWLHHANVDRLFALWQALNPDSWMVPTINAYGSYYESPGTVDSSSSALAPFHADNGTTLFTSDDVRPTARFGYAYPELPDWSMNATGLMYYARQQINQLYNPFLSPSRKRLRSVPLRRAVDLASAFSYITLDDARRLGVNNANRQWFAKINIERFAYDTSFALYFFMGDPPEDVASWPSAPNLIGTQGQFINADVASMHPEGRPRGMLEGQMSLTHTLVAGMDRDFIADLSPDSVVPVLQRGLQWRASSADGCEIAIPSLTGLSVSVGSRSVRPARDHSCFPTYGAVEWYGSVTQGKPGGATQYYRLAY
jgi:tyrosinase